jgi:DNA-binding NarL/FixJ family response regulator
MIYIAAIDWASTSGRSMASVGKIRVLIAEDNAAYRYALLRVLKEYPNLEVVGEVTNGEDAILRAEELRPTIVLMDINMPKLDGIAATRHIKAHYNEITVIGLSVRADRHYVDAMRNAGAAEFLPKEKATEDLYGAIQRAMAWRTSLP